MAIKCESIIDGNSWVPRGYKTKRTLLEKRREIFIIRLSFIFIAFHLFEENEEKSMLNKYQFMLEAWGKLEGVERNPLKRSAMNFSIGIILDSHSKLYLVCEQTTGIKLKKHKIIYVLWSSFDVNKCMNAFLRSREERT